MQKSNLKNAFIAAGIAVFAGVITLGANVAFGVDAPKQDPSTAGLVAPTFSGVDVRGDIKNNGSTVTGGSTVENPVMINDTQGLKINTGILDVWHSIKNLKPDATGITAVKIDDDLDITGVIKNPTPDGTNNVGVKIEDMVDIYGDVNILPSDVCDTEGAVGCIYPYGEGANHSLSVSGDAGVTGQVTIGKGAKIGTFLEVNGAISNPGVTAVRIDDALVVGNEYNGEQDYNTKNVHVYGDLSLKPYYLCDGSTADCPDTVLYKSSATVSGDVKVDGTINAKNIMSDGAIFLKNSPLWLSTVAYIDQTLNGPLRIQADYDRDLELQAGKSGVIAGAYMKLKAFHKGSRKIEVGASTNSTDLKVFGKATSTGGFGTFKRIESAFVSVGANSYAEASQACGAGTYLVSCGGKGSAALTYSATGNISFSNLDPFTNNTCYARGVNNSSTPKYIAAIAVCHDPAN